MAQRAGVYVNVGDDDGDQEPCLGDQKQDKSGTGLGPLVLDPFRRAPPSGQQGQACADAPAGPSRAGSRCARAFAHRFRYVVLLLGWLCMTAVASNMNVYNMTKLCMTARARPPNGTNPYALAFTESQHNGLIMAAALGTAAGTAPLSLLFHHFKGRWTFVAAGLLSAASTALIPLGARLGIRLLWALRFAQGIAYAADFAAMGLICSMWAPLTQSALFISVLTCYNSLSTLTSSPISGILCNSELGWESAFYLHSAWCVVLFGLWSCFYDDYPNRSPFVSHRECEIIQKGKSAAHRRMDAKVPYRAILSSGLVWVVWLNAFMDIFSGIFMLTYQPTYLSKVLKYDIQQTGFLHTVGPIAHIPLKFLFGTMSDKVDCMSERHKMILFNTIAVAGPALSYLVVGFAPLDRPLLSVLAFMSTGVFFSTAGGGFYKCAAVCCRQYAHVVIASMQFTKALTMLVGPTLMDWLVRDVHERAQWRRIFVGCALLLLLASGLFAWLATDEQCAFTREEVKQVELHAPHASPQRVQPSPVLRERI